MTTKKKTTKFFIDIPSVQKISNTKTQSKETRTSNKKELPKMERSPKKNSVFSRELKKSCWRSLTSFSINYLLGKKLDP